MADFSALFAELGGDNPQNRAIAEGLQKQGVSSTKDIGVRQIPEMETVAVNIPDGSDAGWHTESQRVPTGNQIDEFFNKATGSTINPGRLGIIQNGTSGVKGGDIFFHLRSDNNGNISFEPQWSPRAHGFLRDNPLGQFIMKAGSIVPNPFQAAFVAANALDAAAHGKPLQALAAVLPYGLQEFATASNLAELAGNSDFVSTAKTAAGKIAEAAGAPSAYADAIGKAGIATIKTGLTGGDLGKSLLMSQLPSPGSFAKDAGDFSKGIAGLDVGDTPEFDANALNEMPEAIGNGLGSYDMRADENGLGQDLAVDMRADENGLGDDLAVDTRADENGIGSLNPQNDELSNNPFKAVDDSGIAGLDSEYKLDGAGPDYVSPKGEGMVDDAGYVDDTSIPLDKVTVRPGWTSWEGDDNEPDWNSWEGGDNPPSNEFEGEGWGTIGEGEFGDEIKAPVDLTNRDNIEPEEPVKPEEPPPKDVDNTGYLPKVPPVFPPKSPTPYPKPSVSPVDPLAGIITTLLPVTKSEPSKEPVTPVPDSLKGNYTFSWNKQPVKKAEKGVAYGQAFYGNHWNQPKLETSKETSPSEEGSNFAMAEGGLMALDKTTLNTTFKPTMIDGGISAGDITKEDVAGQVIKHMRRGGHVVDHKTHKDVHYLASKGEPVHHIVGFMNHRKRMAEGGITSHSLGSYSDGGHLLKGPGDGMSDDIPATIADKQPARLANEEFVIPADVVSHLGNGSSESGAKVLYEMMSRIRKARTGNPKQGKQIDPHKLLPKV